MRVGGSGHKIIWTTAEKSIPWKDGEPNGAGNTGTSPEDCAEYGTVGNSGGGGLNDVSCSARHTASQLLCRLAPAKIDALRAVPQPATSSSNSLAVSQPATSFSNSLFSSEFIFLAVIALLGWVLCVCAVAYTRIAACNRRASNSTPIWQRSKRDDARATMVLQFSPNGLGESASARECSAYELQTATNLADSEMYSTITADDEVHQMSR